MCSQKWWNVSFFFLFSPNNGKFSMYAWGKKGKMLVFTGVYVCVKAKLTLVRFFFLFFFLHLSFKDKTTHQRLGYNSLMWYTGLPVRHGLPNPIVVCTNERTRSLSSVIAKVSYVLFYWSRPHAIIRGWVSSSCFLQILLITGYVLGKNLQFWLRAFFVLRMIWMILW